MIRVTLDLPDELALARLSAAMASQGLRLRMRPEPVRPLAPLAPRLDRADVIPFTHARRPTSPRPPRNAA
jgi:hypothetical protein